MEVSVKWVFGLRKSYSIRIVQMNGAVVDINLELGLKRTYFIKIVQMN